ncbi:MAG: aminotransferase class I/II-fold pyridoxal phosphate-dependent enzyme [Bdellovibrionales bacterium]|nr:aminotransferase class I/II-fold pyridoxal phosphate-dependent enzyme [Bdellovibrionales bacterium]
MNISKRAQEIDESITLKLNAKANSLAESGKHIYNLTAGQLPFRPLNDFIDLIKDELSFVKSYQYSPVAGIPALRNKVIERIEKTRNVDFSGLDTEFDCIISNGAKHSVSNALSVLIDKGDEVVLFAPYWVSYPQMIKFYGGIPHYIKSNVYDVFIPSMDDLKKSLSPKTKAIILNSPNNPSGTHYPEEWCRDFAKLMVNYPNVVIISDEIYNDLYYFDPKPVPFYRGYPELLERTIIIDGISKTLASTGLRIGYAVGPKEIISAMTKVQGQTTSGANTLMQKALSNFDFSMIEKYLEPIKLHLRDNSQVLQEKYRSYNLSHCWYQPVSAFYYLIDFSKVPLIEKFKNDHDDSGDYANEICNYLLEEKGLAMVPGSDFGMPNTARISLVLEHGPFEEAMEILLTAMTSS